MKPADTKTILFLLFMLLFLRTEAQFRTRFLTFQFDYYGNPIVEYNGEKKPIAQYALGLGVNTGTEHFSGFLEYNYNRISLKALQLSGVKSISYHEFYLGIRYYPLKPTFLLGRTAVRLTAAAAGGLDLEPNWKFMVLGGFFLSPILDTSGASISFVYRTNKYSANGYALFPTWAIRVGLVLGASAKN